MIVGQGLAGTWLSWWLEQSDLSYRVIDSFSESAASRHAAGLINPITGRRLVKTWMIDELMPFALDAYRQIGAALNREFIRELPVVDFFPTVQMLQAFRKRFEEDPTYLHLATERETERYSQWFRFDLGCGMVQPTCLVQTETLLLAWRDQLKSLDKLQEDWFDNTRVRIDETGVEYEGARYRYLVCCDGKEGAAGAWFGKLPFALNKGEALIVEIAGLPNNAVFKKGMSILPWKGNNTYWVGSSYLWSYDNDQPSEAFRSATEAWLKSFLKLPFRVLDHFAALRPATLERRPFLGFHPLNPRIGLFNGLGTKGCSLAPYFGKQLAERIVGDKPLDPQVDIQRFERILSRN